MSKIIDFILTKLHNKDLLDYFDKISFLQNLSFESSNFLQMYSQKKKIHN